jgi:hypothetical protein
LVTVVFMGNYDLKRVHIRRIAPWVVGAVWIAVGVCCWPYTADDAYIVARYARNLAQGFGYAFNPGVRSDGVTGPLWVLPGFLASMLGLEPVTAAKAVGLVCAAAAAFLLVRRAGQRAFGSATACILLFLLAGQPTPPTWAIGALETGAATLVLVGAWLAASRRPAPQYWVTGLSAGVLFWLRPELAPFGIAMVGWLAWRDRRRARTAALFALGGLVSVLLWRYLLFGTWLPLSVWAKPPELGHGIDYVARAVLLTTGAGGAVLYAVALLRGRGDDRLLGWLVLLQLGVLVLAGGDWMPGFRLIAPLVPLYALLAARGFVLLSRQRIGGFFGVLCLLTACGMPLVDLATRVGDLREAGVARERVGNDIAGWLRQRAHRVALVDIGYFGYASGVEVVDLAGLVDTGIARLPGGHINKHIPIALIKERAPDVILFHSSRPIAFNPQGELLTLHGYPVETGLASSAWLRESYIAAKTWRYADRYYYVALLSSTKNK